MVINIHPEQYFNEKRDRWLTEFPNSSVDENGIFHYEHGTVEKGKFMSVEEDDKQKMYFTFICKCKEFKNIPDVDEMGYKKITVYHITDGEWEFYYDLDDLTNEEI